MTRRTKIRIAVAVVVTGALAWAAWPGEDEGAVSVTYAGVSPVDSNLVLFTITNSSKGWVYCNYSAQEHLTVDWFNFSGAISGSVAIPGRSATNFSHTVPCTNRWRIIFSSVEPLPDTYAVRTQLRLGTWVDQHGWPRLSAWVYPDAHQWKYTSSPEMLGNKPVTATEK